MSETKTIQESLIEPIIIVNNMFLQQLNEVNRMFHGKLPKHMERIHKNLETLVKQYEEDKSCH